MGSDESSGWSLSMIFAPLRAKPWLGLVFALFMIGGIGGSFWTFPAELGVPLRLAFGVLLGVGAMLSLYLPRMIATDFDG